VSVPAPPSDIADRKPLIHRVGANALLSRFFGKTNGPIYFDRSDQGRLNAPDGGYGVLYAAETREGSFAESFLRRIGNVSIARDFVEKRAHVSLRVIDDMKLVKFFGNGLARLGATAEVIHSSPPYVIPHRWSSALHAHKDAFDGIAYSSRHNDDEICVALFDRSSGKIHEAVRETDLDQDWFYALANHHGVAIAP